MISGLAHAYRALGEPRYHEAACRGVDVILDHLYDPADRSLLRRWCDGDSRIPGMADDYVFLVQALLDLYEADFQLHWLQKALQFNETAVQHFYDAETGGFYLTRRDHDQGLILRVKEDTDTVLPSASSVAARNLLRLGNLTGREDWRHMADRTIASGLARMQTHPEAVPGMLLAHRSRQAPWIQIAVVGPWEHPETRAMLEAARTAGCEDQALAWIADDAQRRRTAQEIPFVARAQPLKDRPAAYVCIQRSCREPLTTAAELAKLLTAAGKQPQG